jgi:hypothetical protein
VSGHFCAGVLDAGQQWLATLFASKVEDRFDGVGYLMA